MAGRPEQTLAVEKPAANDQLRRLFEQRGDCRECLDDRSVGCVEAELMRSRGFPAMTASAKNGTGPSS